MRKLGFLIASFVLLLVASCEDPDIVPPSLTLLSINPNSVADSVCDSWSDRVIHTSSGQNISLELLLEDDVALSQLKVDLHQNFDCHGHKNPTTDWTVLQIQDLVGMAQNQTINLEVPNNVTAGAYHLKISVLDKAGNELEEDLLYDVKVLNSVDTIQPVLSLQLPASTAFSVAKNSSIRFVGGISDNYSLSDGDNGKLTLAYTQLSTGNVQLVKTFELGASVGTSYDFDFTYNLPATLTLGDYRFTLRAFDGVNNESDPIDLNVTLTN